MDNLRDFGALAIAALLLSVTPLCLAAGDTAAGDTHELGTVRIELRGNTKTWTETGPVFETDQDSAFRTERYGERFAYVIHGLPAGLAHLKLAFCEMKYKKRGQRVFDVIVNGEIILDNFDILAWGMPNEAVVVRNDVRVPPHKPLVLQFVAETEQAKISFLRIYTADWSLEVDSHDGEESPLGPSDRDASYMHGMYETCISKFGSRICINPRPQKGICRQSALGHADYNVAYFEDNPDRYRFAPTAVYYAVRSDNPDSGSKWYSLPFNGTLPPFTDVRQHQTLTSLSYTCRSPDLPVEITYTFRAPFYPEDVKLSCAPFILLDVTVRNLTDTPSSGAVVVGQVKRSWESEATEQVTEISRRNCIGVEHRLKIFGKNAAHAWLADKAGATGVTAHAGTLIIPPRGQTQPDHRTDPDGRTIPPTVWADTTSGLKWEYQLDPRATDTRTFAYVGWVAEPILDVLHQPHHFKYIDLFEDMYAVARFAFDNRSEIDRKVRLFESTVQDATIHPRLKRFLPFAFQSWMQNTFLCANEAGQDWFSVWEGCCKFHSTVDVEYNVAPLYFAYWPNLMEITLYEWTSYIRDGVLSHDMGMGLEANGMEYGHDMEIEENTNFVLLLHQYWTRTGNDKPVRDLFDYVQELLQYVIDCDTDGDGFHERGTSNTIDQGSNVIQHAEKQTYLAVRALAALHCGAQMAQMLDRPQLAEDWRSRAKLIAKTLESHGWLGDHYAIALNKPPENAQQGPADDWGPGMRRSRDYAEGYDPWEPGMGSGMGADYSGSGYATAPGYTPPDHWDGYSIYATNGLLYPMRSASTVPGIDLQKMRKDLQEAVLNTQKKYGSPHSNHESNMWVSQNLWRDMAAAYLGIDLVDNATRYMELQEYINREKRGCFTDVYVYGSDRISLDYYPRGTAAFGLIPALAGLQVDKTAQIVSVSPLRQHLRIPLLAYADWKAEKVPWLDITAIGDEVTVEVEGDVDVEVQTRPLGQPW